MGIVHNTGFEVGDMELQTTDIRSEEWFQSMIEELHTTLVESEFNAKWILLQSYHYIGSRILEEYGTRKRLDESKFIENIAESLARSTRTIYYMVKFVRTFPVLDDVPEGKSISWHKLCTKYLTPGGKEKEIKPPEMISIETLRKYLDDRLLWLDNNPRAYSTGAAELRLLRSKFIGSAFGDGISNKKIETEEEINT